MVLSLEKYEYKKLRKYPHMLARDIRIWELFMEQKPDEYLEVAYDVKVGKGVELPDDYPGNMKRDALALTRKRIDVVGWRKYGVDVIEVKPEAGLSAVGQVLSYQLLWMLQVPGGGYARALVITDRIGTDMRTLGKGLGFWVYSVGGE